MRGRRIRPARRCSMRHPRPSAATSSRAATTRKPCATTDFVQPALLACDVAAFRVLQAEGLTVRGRGGPFARRVRRVGGRRRRGPRRRARARRGAGRRDAARRRGAAGRDDGVARPRRRDAAALCEAARDGDELVVANENSPVQWCVSGSSPRSSGSRRSRRIAKMRAVRLPVAGAFHSALMRPAVQPRSTTLARSTFATPCSRSPRTSTGELVTDPATLRELLGRHVVSPVRWERRCAASPPPAPRVSSRPGPATSSPS